MQRMEVGFLFRGTKIPHAMGQLSLCVLRREKPAYHKERPHMLQIRPDTAK